MMKLEIQKVWFEGFLLILSLMFTVFMPCDAIFQSERSTPSPFLPKLLPHDDNCYLLEFVAGQNNALTYMEPLVKRLERDIGVRVKRLDVTKNIDYYHVLEHIGHIECGMFPFYYNRRTSRAICGGSEYVNFREWATGFSHQEFYDSSENEMQEAQDMEEIGVEGMFKDFVRKTFRFNTYIGKKTPLTRWEKIKEKVTKEIPKYVPFLKNLRYFNDTNKNSGRESIKK